MTLNTTPSAERTHIGIFGKRNAGKSSLINALTSQNTAIVSAIKGTTTDPVYKAMEILPLGPVMIIDTPGIDDTGSLGELRINKTYQILNKTDIALIVIDALTGPTKEDFMIINYVKEKNIPVLLVFNKSELITLKDEEKFKTQFPTFSIHFVSAEQGKNISFLREAIAKIQPKEIQLPIVADLLNPGDLVILVVPIDSSAPKGRLILPQQQTIRDILDIGASALVVKDTEYLNTLKSLGKIPRLVITDSQVFKKIANETPPHIPLTSFSILFARYKGDLAITVSGVTTLDTLKSGDKILIGEGCSHHRQCDDIGTVKLPRWLKEYTGKELEFIFTSGHEFPIDLSPYKMIIHCGGCMLNQREMQSRINSAQKQAIPITNYGITIAYINGILKRTLEPFPKIYAMLKK